MNNGATNVYYILTLNFIAYYANGVLGLLLIFATTMVTVMRLFDAVTDSIIGALIDRTSTKFGKFRPFMVLGNVIDDRVIDLSVFWDTDHQRGHDVASLCVLRIILCTVCHWLYISDSMYPFRTDLSDKRPEAETVIYDF